jgi:hypothetical protein
MISVTFSLMYLIFTHPAPRHFSCQLRCLYPLSLEIAKTVLLGASYRLPGGCASLHRARTRKNAWRCQVYYIEI